MNRDTKRVIIDAYRGGDDIGSSVNGIVEKDYNLALSKYIYDRLKSLGVDVSLTRDNDETIDIDSRVERIKAIYGTGSDVIVISNALTTGGEDAEVVYALRNSSGLSERVASELKKVGVNVGKYYQRRLPSDTSKDYNQLIRDTANNQSIIIYYGNIDNNLEANYLKSNMNSIGEAIVIALANYLGITYKPIGDSNYYVVKKGDSLYSIAKKYNTTVNEIKKLNNLSSNNLSIGQVLKLPVEEVVSDDTDILYTVKKGDSLYQISKKYNITVDELKKYNNLSSNILNIGDILKIPLTSEEVSSDYINYKVVSGDNLYSIAKRYNTTVNDIKKLNNLTSNLLSIGQIIKIPTKNSEYIEYKVVSGDSLYSIAKRYNTTVNEIKKLNNLASNLLSIGQIIKIPK